MYVYNNDEENSNELMTKVAIYCYFFNIVYNLQLIYNIVLFFYLRTHKNKRV